MYIVLSNVNGIAHMSNFTTRSLADQQAVIMSKQGYATFIVKSDADYPALESVAAENV